MQTTQKVDVSTDKREWHPSPLPGQVVLVTSVDRDGRPNVATKSWITMVAFGPPPVLVFGCNMHHATAQNIRATGELVVNVPGDDLAQACWAIGTDPVPAGTDRFAAHGLTPIESTRVRPPRIAECRAHLECELHSMREWGSEVAVFGRIVAASLDEALTVGDEDERYRALRPFFFLESGWLAGLGAARPVQGDSAAPDHPLTILAVADLARSVAFYREAFGWPARVEVPVYVELALPDGRGLGLYAREGFAINTGQAPAAIAPGAITGTEIYLRTSDIVTAIARIQGAGARALSPLAPRPWGDDAAYFADPDGNVVVLATPSPAGA